MTDKTIKGMFYDPVCAKASINDENHAVTVVGYGTDSKGFDFWIVRNQWGTDWGMDGYIYMARNRNNNCFIASNASYPVLV